VRETDSIGLVESQRELRNQKPGTRNRGSVGFGLHKLEPKESVNVAADFILKPFPRARDMKLYQQRELIFA
jgi:hypothetical protein